MLDTKHFAISVDQPVGATFSRIVGVAFLALLSLNTRCHSLNTAKHYTHHKTQSIFLLLFSIASSKNSMTLRLLNLDSASPNLHDSAIVPLPFLFMWNQV